MYFVKGEVECVGGEGGPMPLALSLIDSFTSTAVHCYSHSSAAAAATAPSTTTAATGLLPTAASRPLSGVRARVVVN